jgi:hypothetical protein
MVQISWVQPRVLDRKQVPYCEHLVSYCVVVSYGIVWCDVV